MDKLGSRAIVGIGAKFSGKISGAQSIEINGNVVADLVADIGRAYAVAATCPRSF